MSDKKAWPDNNETSVGINPVIARLVKGLEERIRRLEQIADERLTKLMTQVDIEQKFIRRSEVLELFARYGKDLTVEAEEKAQEECSNGQSS